jgi:predicted 3-demethylubiquinone-9 3-methyltransferase (glyoxalase superfamily)
MQEITPFLWFSDNAEEAVRFYVSIFKNSKIGKSHAMTKRAKRSPGDRRDWS